MVRLGLCIQLSALSHVQMDIAQDEAVARAEADIRAINSTVNIIRTNHSKVDLGMLLSRSSYSHKGEAALPSITEENTDGEEEGSAGERQPAGAVASSSGPADAAHVHAHAHGSLHQASHSSTASASRVMSMTHHRDVVTGHHTHDHVHDVGIATLTLRADKPLSLEK